jgi:hypothetical protein
MMKEKLLNSEFFEQFKDFISFISELHKRGIECILALENLIITCSLKFNTTIQPVF